MARNCFETACVSHQFDTYSPEKIKQKLESLKILGDDEERAQYEKYLNNPNYAQEFSVLYEVKDKSCEMFDDGKGCKYEFKEVEYRRPKIEDEKSDVVSPSSQLELECKLDNDLVFGLSVHKASHKTADKDEPDQFVGQIHIPDETIAKLNEERLNRIFEFCSKYGFSTFGLDVPMKDGVVDLDAKLADLMEKYQEEQARKIAENPGPDKPSEDENDSKGAQVSDYVQLVDDVDTYVDTAGLGKAAQQAKENLKNSAKAVSLDDIVKNMNNFLTKDLHKRRGLSYWEHVKKIDGRRTYVFSIYDKEDPKNYENDGKPDPKNSRVRVPTFSARLYVSQDNDGKFYFGYGTPAGKPMDAGLASDFMGEIKKTGITHLNLKNLPNCDKSTWMKACAERGIVPTGCSYSTQKADMMLKAAKEKLSTQEYANFERSLMEQWEENAKNSGKELPISDLEYIRKKKNEARYLIDNQSDLREAAEFESKFENFRKAYVASDGLYNMADTTIRKGSLNKRTGAASVIAATHTLARVFDLVVGDDNNLEARFASRLDQLMSNPVRDEVGNVTMVRLSGEEKKELLAVVSNKKIKELNKADYQRIYTILYERQLKNADADIVDRIRKSDASNTKRAVPILLGDAWSVAQGQLTEMNRKLKKDIGINPLEVPEKHFGLFYEKSIEILAQDKKKAEEKAKKEEQKSQEQKTQPKPKVSSGREI